MRQPLVAGNWKMNGSLESIQALIKGIREGMSTITSAEVAVCPPFIYMDRVASLIAGSGISLGAQDASHLESGAYTGEVAVSMIKDIGARYVIVGHSERRSLYGEDDDLVARKFTAVLGGGLIPILCVGELLEEREGGQTQAVVGRQIDAVVNHAGIQGFDKAVIAYEPVWAIGTGKTATPEQAQEVHAFIRQRLAKHDRGIADKVQILYGGSVNADNAASIFSKPDVDGGLVGGASLKAPDFLTICQAANA